LLTKQVGLLTRTQKTNSAQKIFCGFTNANALVKWCEYLSNLDKIINWKKVFKNNKNAQNSYKKAK